MNSNQAKRTGRGIKKGPKRFTISMKKRLVVLFLIILTAFFALGIRLYLIQRDNGRSYTMQVLSQQAYNNKSLPCKRGKIMDASGTVLADSQLVYNVIIDAKQMLEKDEYLEPSLAAAERLGIDKEELHVYVKAHPASQYYVARKNLPYQDKRKFDEELEKGIQKEKEALREAEKKAKEKAGGAGEKSGTGQSEQTGQTGQTEQAQQSGQEDQAADTVRLFYSNIKGIWFEESYIRTYPCKTLAADVIGFTLGDNTGAYGLEEYYEETLKGVPGRSYGYLDESLNMEQTTIQPKDGNNLVLTLDANIQSICEKYLNEMNEEFRNRRHKGNGFNNGACIIMDVNTGGILAMASSPGFDLSDPYNISAVAGMPKLDKNYNPISSYMSEADAQTLSDADKSKYLSTLWSNYCISSHFEPGSTAKPFTTGAGLETGKVKPSDKYECNGYLQVGDYYIRCVHTQGDGILDPGGAIERSCNVALMQEAQKIGAETFCEYQNVFNFGLRTNIDLAREARTDEFLYTADEMSDVDLASNSFGQNFEVTMIQMISGFCSLINGGSYYQPHIVDRITSAGGSTVLTNSPRLLKKTVSEETSAMLRKYCIQVVEGENGTGPQARPAGYRIGGKTGTAETLPRENGQYIVSFLGFAPAENPRIAIYVVLDRMNKKQQDESLWASITARKILTEVLPYMNIYMTEPLTDEERIELEKQGLYDTNDRTKDRQQERTE